MELPDFLGVLFTLIFAMFFFGPIMLIFIAVWVAGGLAIGIK